jgi:hypothetical protein
MAKEKSLEDKAIDIKGSKYVLVSDRVTYFNEQYPNGSIRTELISDPTSDIIVIKGIVTPDVEKPARTFEDYAQEIIGSSFINKTSAMENASTSAIGRCLAYMGIGVIDSIASVDEIHKANNRSSGATKKATEKQIEWIMREAESKCGNQDAYEWVTKLLTMKPEDVPVFKVKDAVDLIKSQEVVTNTVEINLDGEKIDLNSIPY